MIRRMSSVRPTTSALLASTVIAFGGCGFDLTEVVPTVQDARLFVQLEAGQRGVPPVLSASFHPGSTVQDGIRPLGDDSIRVNGTAVPPFRVERSGTRLYNVSGLDVSSFPLLFQAPHVEGLPEPLPMLDLNVIGIMAPDTLVVARGAMMEIGLTGMAAAAGELTRVFWSVQLNAEGGPNVLSMAGAALPRPLLRIPTEFLPDDLTRGHVRVSVYTLRVIRSLPAAYEISIARSLDASVPFRIMP